MIQHRSGPRHCGQGHERLLVEGTGAIPRAIDAGWIACHAAITDDGDLPGTNVANVDLKIHTVRIGLNYRFGAY